MFNGSNILTSSDGETASLFTPFTGAMPNDNNSYSCLLIHEGAVIFERTIQLDVVLPIGPSSSVELRFSSQPQEQLDDFFVNVLFAPPGLPTLAAFVSDNNFVSDYFLLLLIILHLKLIVTKKVLLMFFLDT